MPNQSEGTAAAPAAQQEEFVSRKLIRPSLGPQARSNQAERNSSERNVPSRAASTEHTHAESFYFQKQIQARTPVTIALKNGETADGIIEWYDRDSLRLLRRDQAHLMIYKTSIKYIYKSAEAKR